MSDREKFYQLSYDSQKWLFSKYDRNIHFQDVRKIIRSLAETVCEMQYNIVCDSALYKDVREKLLEIPRKYGYEIIEINLEADYETLLNRFNERLAEVSTNKTLKVANISEVRFKEIYDIYESEKNPLAISIRTDGRNIEETGDNVLKLL